MFLDRVSVLQKGSGLERHGGWAVAHTKVLHPEPCLRTDTLMSQLLRVLHDGNSQLSSSLAIPASRDLPQPG